MNPISNFLLLLVCLPVTVIAQHSHQRPQPRPPNQPPGMDPRGRPPIQQQPPPNPYQAHGRPPQQVPQAGPMGPPQPMPQGPPQRNGQMPPPPQGPQQRPMSPMAPPPQYANPDVDAVAQFLRTEEGQEELAAAVDKEANVIAQEIIEVLQDDASREDLIGTIDNASGCFHDLWLGKFVFCGYWLLVLVENEF